MFNYRSLFAAASLVAFAALTNACALEIPKSTITTKEDPADDSKDPKGEGKGEVGKDGDTKTPGKGDPNAEPGKGGDKGGPDESTSDPADDKDPGKEPSDPKDPGGEDDDGGDPADGKEPGKEPPVPAGTKPPPPKK